MNLLAFDTSTETLSIALAWQAGGQPRLLEHTGAGGARASATLIPAIQGLLARAGLAAAQLDAIVFGRGPGSFTGLRTACSVAQGLAYGANVPVLPLDTLLAVAEEARARQGATQVVAVLDARMDEVYAAAYAWEGGGWRQHGGYWEKSNHVVAPARPAPRQEDRGHFERRDMPRQEVRPESRNDYREPPRAERREMQPPPRVERQEVRPPANEARRDGWQPRDNRPSPERRDQYTGASPNPPVRAEAPRPPAPAVERSPERRERPQEARNERNDRGDRGDRGDASGRGDRQHDRRGRDEARG